MQLNGENLEVLSTAIARKMHQFNDPDALWDYKDIADYLGWAEGTVSTRIVEE